MQKTSQRPLQCLAVVSLEGQRNVRTKLNKRGRNAAFGHLLSQSSFSAPGRDISIETNNCVPPSRQSVLVQATDSESVTLEGDYRSRPPNEVNVLVVGSTGYIGKFVVKELIRRGYHVIAFARDKSGIGGATSTEATRTEFEGADVRFGEVTDLESLRSAAFSTPVDVVVSCLASRTGGKRDSWLIDYEATLNSLKVAREKGASHFILLSAICVQKPKLEFQRAKLKFEAILQGCKDITYTIIRPTSYFKSLAGQVESVKKGGPFVMFGDGRLTACKPISEADLASFMADAITEKSMINQILPIGGPGAATTPIEQAAMIFKYAKRKERIFSFPIGLMNGLISCFEFLEKFLPNLEDMVEFARIGRYYATESMLVWDEEQQQYNADKTPSYGSDTLDSFFQKSVEGGMKGQELGDQAVFWSGK